MGNYMLRSEGELCHFGVKGMKWGVRRYQNKDGSLTTAGRKRYAESNPYNNTKDQLKEINKIQEIDDFLKSVNALNFKKKYNESKDVFDMVDISYSKKYIDGLMKAHGRKTVSEFLKIVEPIDETGFHLKLFKKSSIEDDAKKANPNYTDLTISSSNNCTLSTVAYDLRRRGYDVTAKQAEIKLLYNVGPNDVQKWYPGSTVKKFDIKSDYDSLYKEAFSEIEKQPNGARGNVMISWGPNKGGHSVAYEIINNKAVLVDAQTGDIYKNPKELFNEGTTIQYIRTDNITPDWEKIKQAVE